MRAEEVADLACMSVDHYVRLEQAMVPRPSARILESLAGALRLARSPGTRSPRRTNPVRAPGHRTKTLTHPEVGQLRVNCDVLTVPDDDQQVVFMTADPDTASARALRHLAAKAAA